jgi:phosphoribosyl-ATP pyrophosphohydrolase
MADLVYHSLVLLTTRGLTWDDVLAELEKRHKP